MRPRARFRRRCPALNWSSCAGTTRGCRERLEAIEWEIPARIEGFVDNMPELMSASDLLVTKAGPGTLAEAFIAGLPVIIFGYTPGQETANVDYVLNHRAGAFATEPAEIARIAGEWLQPGQQGLGARGGQRCRACASRCGIGHCPAALFDASYGPGLASRFQRFQWLEARLSH